MGGLLHLVQQGGAWVGCSSAQSPPRCIKCNSPPINHQCTNYCIAKVRCSANVVINGLRSATCEQPVSEKCSWKILYKLDNRHPHMATRYTPFVYENRPYAIKLACVIQHATASASSLANQ